MTEEMLSFYDVVHTQKESNVQLASRKFLLHDSLIGEVISVNGSKLNYVAVIDDSDNDAFYKKYNLTGKKMNRSPIPMSSLQWRLYGARIEQEHKAVEDAISACGLKIEYDQDGNIWANIPENSMIRIKDNLYLDSFTITCNNVDLYISVNWSKKKLDIKDPILEEIGWK